MPSFRPDLFIIFIKFLNYFIIFIVIYYYLFILILAIRNSFPFKKRSLSGMLMIFFNQTSGLSGVAREHIDTLTPQLASKQLELMGALKAAQQSNQVLNRHQE